MSGKHQRDIDMFDEEPQIKQDSQIFTQHLPVIGKIPMGKQLLHDPSFSYFSNVSYVLTS